MPLEPGQYFYLAVLGRLEPDEYMANLLKLAEKIAG